MTTNPTSHPPVKLTDAQRKALRAVGSGWTIYEGYTGYSFARSDVVGRLVAKGLVAFSSPPFNGQSRVERRVAVLTTAGREALNHELGLSG